MLSKLKSVERQTGKRPPELDNLVELPQSCTLIWTYFIKLNNSRQSGMSVNPISYQEILAFDKLYNLELTDWEIDCIVMLDRVAIKQYQKQQEEHSKNNNKKK